MNTRRTFLKNLGGLIGMSIFVPNIIIKPFGLSDDKLSSLPPEDKELTEQFFGYLKTHPVYFEWERIYTSWFRPIRRNEQPNNYKVYVTETYKTVLYDPNWQIELIPTFRTEEEYRESLFNDICETIYNRPEGKKYLYYLEFSPILYAKEQKTQPYKDILIRGII